MMKKWIADIREKTKDMSRSQKIEYIRNYYWYHILIGCILLGLSVLFIWHIGWGKKEEAFSCVIVNQKTDYERDSSLARKFSAYAGLEEEEVSVDSDYQISYGDKKLEGVNESSYEKFFFNWSAGVTDAMIMPESFYDYCILQGGVFTEDKIPIKETRLRDVFEEEEGDPVVLVFAADSRHKKACGLFLDYLCGKEQ